MGEQREARAFDALRMVAGRLALDVEGYPADTDADGKLIGAVEDWAAGTAWRRLHTLPARNVDEIVDVEPDYRAHSTGEWVWVCPAETDGKRYGLPGGWALGRTANGVGVHIAPGDGERPADVLEPVALAMAVLSALRRPGPAQRTEPDPTPAGEVSTP